MRLYKESVCVQCNGSGEGMHDGSTCSACGGEGLDLDIDRMEFEADMRADFEREEEREG